MRRKEYEHELRRLHGELVAVQEWVKDTGAKVCIVFEGRDTAGKGGTIKAVERVMGSCTPDETRRFLEQAPGVGKAMIDSGILLLNLWLEVSPDGQTRRLQSRIDDPRKFWKLADMDLLSQRC